jgi:hypothetical protein
VEHRLVQAQHEPVHLYQADFIEGSGVGLSPPSLVLTQETCNRQREREKLAFRNTPLE